MGGRTKVRIGSGLVLAALGAMTFLHAVAAGAQDPPGPPTGGGGGANGQTTAPPPTTPPASPTAVPAVTCASAALDPEAPVPVAVLLVQGGDEDANDETKLLATEVASKLASDEQFEFIGAATLDEGESNPAKLPPLTKELKSDVKPESGAYVLVAFGDESVTRDDVNDALGLRDNDIAFVRTANDLGVDASTIQAGARKEFVESLAATSGNTVVKQLKADQGDLALTVTESPDRGSYEVDLKGRPAPKQLTVAPGSVTLDGEVVAGCGGSLPLSIKPEAGTDSLVGKELALTVEGENVSATIGENVTDPTGTTTTTTEPKDNGSNGNNGNNDDPDNQTASGTDDKGDGSGRSSGVLMYMLLFGVLVLGGVGLFGYLQRRRPATAGPGGSGFDPTGYPPSPHGPSAGGYGPGGAGGAALPAPPAGAGVAAVAAVPAVGRATTAPEVGPLTLPDPAPGWTAAVPRDGSVRLADIGLMRVLPSDRASGRTWSLQTSATICTAGWLEKKAGKGEDAEPVMRSHDNGRGLLAVFDGTGGAGSAPARRLRDGTELTGAYVGARLARDLTESWYTDVVRRSAMADDAEGLHDLLDRGFRDEAAFIEDTGSTLKGSLSRVLPTTLAAIAYGAIEQDGRVVSIVDALWAGDSRAYILTPSGGLQVLTVDDTRETDALALIRNDQPMDNLVAADRPFLIHHRQVRVAEPAVLLTATDGCFGYIRTPAHLEYFVLRNLLSAQQPDGWSGGLLDALHEFTADDASFVLAGIGWERFADLKAAFADRYDAIARTHWEPFAQAEGDQQRIEELREQSWAAYADGYHARVMPAEG